MQSIGVGKGKNQPARWSAQTCRRSRRGGGDQAPPSHLEDGADVAPTWLASTMHKLGESWCPAKVNRDHCDTLCPDKAVVVFREAPNAVIVRPGTNQPDPLVQPSCRQGVLISDPILHSSARDRLLARWIVHEGMEMIDIQTYE
ncbi:hypothetical protein CLAIMM_07571 isoform 2 [Cladophialophora immunda]|nr:hypothetical protein CLAIMM_07571 isoform 1 [Cladophialophora immunda]OQV02365.1 hypothetical protein CLAIMM_07571 isoform 2 [Cladophialophora immunda]